MGIFQTTQIGPINDQVEETFYKRQVKRYNKSASDAIYTSLIMGIVCGVGAGVLVLNAVMPNPANSYSENILTFVGSSLISTMAATGTGLSILRAIGSENRAEDYQAQIDLYNAKKQNSAGHSMGGY